MGEATKAAKTVAEAGTAVVRFIENENEFKCPVCGKTFPKVITTRRGNPMSGKIPCIGHYNSEHQKIHPHGGSRIQKASKSPDNHTAVNDETQATLTTTGLEAGSFGQGESASPITILPVNFQDYMPRNKIEYISSNEELTLFQAHLSSGVPLLQTGPKGVGKTLSLAYFSYTEQIPLIQFDCSENVKRSDLIGRFVLKGEEVAFMLGALASAIEVANQYGKAILVLEEVNALSPNMQKVLNQLLDWRRHVYVPEIYRTYRLREGAQLLVAATMNPSTYGGVFQLNEDLKSRFAEMFVPYPDEEHEMKVIDTANSDLEPETLKQILLLAKETRSTSGLSYALSPRDTAMFAKVYSVYTKSFKSQRKALRYALKTCVVDRYEDEAERKTVIERIRSIFGSSAL